LIESGGAADSTGSLDRDANKRYDTAQGKRHSSSDYIVDIGGHQASDHCLVSEGDVIRTH
jgi:hypothetical protein